jgi:ssDNA-specific exonuclease RecJ
LSKTPCCLSFISIAKGSILVNQKPLKRAKF